MTLEEEFQPIREALDQLESLKEPSLAKILRQNGYEYEAIVIENLLDAFANSGWSYEEN